MSNSEYHIASYIVRTRKGELQKLENKINNINCLEVHCSDSQSKLIVTAESNSHKGIAQLADKIYGLTEVLDVSAVYHEYLEEETN